MNCKSFLRGNRIILVMLSVFMLPTALCAESPVAKGRLKFDGQVVITDINPTFWFRDEGTGKQASARVEFKNGEFQIFGLAPGHYGTGVRIDLNPENQAGRPGDLSSWEAFSISPGTITELEIEMTKLIHMTSPLDNATLVEGKACEGDVNHSSPVKIAWDPLLAEAYYDYKVITASCKPFEYGDAVASGTTKELSVTLDLPPNRPNEIYRLTLSARKLGNRVGSMETHGGSFRAWDYRFRVQQNESRQDISKVEEKLRPEESSLTPIIETAVASASRLWFQSTEQSLPTPNAESTRMENNDKLAVAPATAPSAQLTQLTSGSEEERNTALRSLYK